MPQKTRRTLATLFASDLFAAGSDVLASMGEMTVPQVIGMVEVLKNHFRAAEPASEEKSVEKKAASAATKKPSKSSRPTKASKSAASKSAKLSPQPSRRRSPYSNSQPTHNISSSKGSPRRTSKRPPAPTKRTSSSPIRKPSPKRPLTSHYASPNRYTSPKRRPPASHKRTSPKRVPRAVAAPLPVMRIVACGGDMKVGNYVFILTVLRALLIKKYEKKGIALNILQPLLISDEDIQKTAASISYRLTEEFLSSCKSTLDDIKSADDPYETRVISMDDVLKESEYKPGEETNTTHASPIPPDSIDNTNHNEYGEALADHLAPFLIHAPQGTNPALLLLQAFLNHFNQDEIADQDEKTDDDLITVLDVPELRDLAIQISLTFLAKEREALRLLSQPLNTSDRTVLRGTTQSHRPIVYPQSLSRTLSEAPGVHALQIIEQRKTRAEKMQKVQTALKNASAQDEKTDKDNFISKLETELATQHLQACDGVCLLQPAILLNLLAPKIADRTQENPPQPSHTQTLEHTTYPFGYRVAEALGCTIQEARSLIRRSVTDAQTARKREGTLRFNTEELNTYRDIDTMLMSEGIVPQEAQATQEKTSADYTPPIIEAVKRLQAVVRDRIVKKVNAQRLIEANFFVSKLIPMLKNAPSIENDFKRSEVISSVDGILIALLDSKGALSHCDAQYEDTPIQVNGTANTGQAEESVSSHESEHAEKKECASTPTLSPCPENLLTPSNNAEHKSRRRHSQQPTTTTAISKDSNNLTSSPPTIFTSAAASASAAYLDRPTTPTIAAK